MLGRKPSQITNDARERLYGSVIDVETKLADSHSMEILGEDAEIRVRNRVSSYAKKFVEGLFVIDDHDIPDSLLATVKTRDDLRSLPVSWAAMTNAFIAPTGSNTRLKVYKPAGIDLDRAQRGRARQCRCAQLLNLAHKGLMSPLCRSSGRRDDKQAGERMQQEKAR